MAHQRRHVSEQGASLRRGRGALRTCVAVLLVGASGLSIEGQNAPPAPTTPAAGAPTTPVDTQKPSASPDSLTDNAPSPVVTGGKAIEIFDTPTKPAPPPPAPGAVLDRVVAVVNGDVVLESDVDEERRFAAFQPITAPTGDFTRERALGRLINRALILQQAKLQPLPPITDADVDKELMQLRTQGAACKMHHCETKAGWESFVAEQGFTMPELIERWRQRMEVLRFIELRFRMGIHIAQSEIEAYYTKTLLPEYAKRGVKAPKLDDAISNRIQEVLLQQQVSSLLQDWLKSLRAQGSVQIMSPDGTGPA